MNNFNYIPFKTAKYLGSKHVQTVYNVLFPPVDNLRTDYYCEDIIIPIGELENNYLWLEHNPPVEYYSKRISYNGFYLILIHGMEGDSGSHYIVNLTKTALEHGFGVVRVNMRGCGKGANLSDISYHAGKSEDIEEIENYVYKYFSKNIIISGFSLSANILLKYLGEHTYDHKCKLFSAVSPPLDLKFSCENIDSPSGKFYRNRFLKSFKKKIKNGTIRADEKTKEAAFQVKTMFDFDDTISAPIFGYKSALDYYKYSSSIHYIYNIKHTGIIIHADDDPLIPSSIYQSIDWSKILNITPILTRGGGHVGFYSELLPNGFANYWINYILINYFIHLLNLPNDVSRDNYK